MKLEEYELEIIYKKGKQYANADALSRINFNAIENESVINNPGDVDKDILDFLKNCAENPIDSVAGPSKRNTQPKFKILQDIQITPPFPINNNDLFTNYSCKDKTTINDLY